MIEGLYYTTLVALAAPAKLRIKQDDTGMVFYTRYQDKACSFTVSFLEMLSVVTHKQLVTLIENKINENKTKLLNATSYYKDVSSS